VARQKQPNWAHIEMVLILKWSKLQLNWLCPYSKAGFVLQRDSPRFVAPKDPKKKKKNPKKKTLNNINNSTIGGREEVHLSHAQSVNENQEEEEEQQQQQSHEPKPRNPCCYRVGY
jgi:hypothetical protein